MCGRERGELINTGRVNWAAGGDFGDAWIAWGRVNLRYVRVLRERPSKSVLAAADSDDEDLHTATSRIECQAFISSRVRSTGFFFNPRYSPVTQAKHISPCLSPIPLLSPSISL